MILSRKAKESIKIGLAMTITYGIALQMDWDKPLWSGFAVAFVSLATVGQSFSKAALRMFGTLVAVVVALTIIALISYRTGQGFLQSIPSFTSKFVGCNV